MKKYNIVYVTTYIDKEISEKIKLPYSVAGLKKKNELLEILGKNHNIKILFTTMFSRIREPIIKPFEKKISNNIKITIPFYFKFPVLNFIFNPILTFMELRKIYKKKKIDYIILYNCVYENVFPVYLFYKCYPVKIICQYEDGWIMSSKGFKKYLHYFSHKLAEKISNSIIVNSTKFLEIFDCNNSFVFRGNMKEEILENNNHKFDRRFNILFSSRIDNIRGAELLIEFFNQVNVNEEFLDICFHITGNGDTKIIEKLKEAIYFYTKRGGLAKYYGFVSKEKLQELYNKADILFALQKPDGKFSKYCFPSKIFEYYKYNKPIVTTKISDLDSDDFFNLEFIEYDINDMIDKILHIKRHYKEYSDKNKNNSFILSQKFSIQENIKAMNKFLENVNEKIN